MDTITNFRFNICFMKPTITLSLLLLILIANINCTHQTIPQQSVNHHNLVLNIDFPDPTVINVNGTFYAYATQAPQDGKMNNIQLATSKNLFNWTYMGDALPQKPLWA